MIPFALRAGELLLDSPTRDDVEAITGYCSEPLFERFMTTPWPYTRAHAERFVDRIVPDGWASGRELTWAIREGDGGPLLGAICLRDRGPEAADLGFWLGAPHRGRGLMKAAVTAVSRWALDLGGWQRVLWETQLGNVASASVARAAGFRFLGEDPSHVPGRHGEPVPSWHGELGAADSSSPKTGWPL
ncbi:GNAT family N-acetyltransferase [Glaciihabitans arcticus]|uniref:GNAT family N-acetyltransferase n=1 Tax=Glaciihabitans arcticus TaxID=2668039 RepID=UPI001386C64E|nr:GNAT family N-acetyltransferase [Glaciihabitans arcticus]